MIRHILFVKLKDNSPSECESVKALFLSMKDQIPCIREMQVGIDFLHSDRSYDLVLELTLDDLQSYQNHPYHVQQVKPVIHAKRCASATVDYQL